MREGAAVTAHRPSRIALLTIALLVLGLAPPAGADHETNTRSGLEEVGFHPLHNTGFNTVVWPWVGSATNRLYAAVGTWGTLTAFADPGEECPSETDNPAAPTHSGVKIVDATDPANPVLIETIGTVPGAQNNEVRIAHIDTNKFTGDLLAHSLEPCGAEGLLHQLAAPPEVPTAVTGFQLYDVDDPSNPVKLGTYNNGGIGTHNLYFFSRPDLNPPRAYVAAVYNEVVAGGILGIRGELQIVEVTDPSNPTLVGEWELATPNPDIPCEERGVDSAFCVLHDVWVSDDGKTAYLSFWDAGLILLDITDPANPALIGRAQEQVEGDGVGWLDEEGNTHSALPFETGGRKFVIVGDEDFTGGGEIGVTVNAPADLAGFRKATHWDGTAPVTGQTADLVYAGTGCTAANYAPLVGQIEGKIALVDKFAGQNPTDQCPTFTFKQKMDAAANAGAIGLVQVDNNDAASGGNAIQSTIPGLEISNSAGVPIRNEVTDGDGVAVNATLGRGGQIDPWGFMRVVDVTDPNPANWRQVFTHEGPHTRDFIPPPESDFTAHNPILGPDGRLYFSWFTSGVRVLEPAATPGHFTEVAWFVPRPTDHEGDLDEDPHGAQADNVGFWQSWPVCHPTTGDLLVFNSDINRGLYILRSTETDCRTRDLTLSSGDITFTKRKFQGADVVTINARIHNLGTGDASNVEVKFVVDGSERGRTTISTVPAGGSATTSLLWGNVKHLQGLHTVVVTADPDNDIEETNEANNTATRQVEILGNKIRPR
jgi:hypothetical protein